VVRRLNHVHKCFINNYLERRSHIGCAFFYLFIQPEKYILLPIAGVYNGDILPANGKTDVVD
jgi:hypothetical protein